MSTTRREFLGMAATASVGAMLPWQAGTAAAHMSALMPGPVGVATPPLAKFVTSLPKPAVATLSPDLYNGLPLYKMALAPVDHIAHPSLGITPAWGYGGSFPGPTIEARLDSPFAVKWENNLPGTHLLQSAIDPTVHGADPALYPPVRAVTHLHGGHVPHTVDGGPDAWYVNPLTVPPQYGPGQQQGPAFAGDTYIYPNHQHRATTLWYHDHALGITRLNVYAGLAGFYILRSAAEDALGLPSGNYEIPIVFQDRLFNADGSLYYPPPPHVPEFFGDTMVVNGQVWPRLVVENRKYRFRFLNGCNARFLRMRLIQSDLNGIIPASASQWVLGPAFDQIGSDGGLFNQAAPMPILTMGPGERCDVIVDFSKALGKPANMKPQKRAYFLLYNDAAVPFSNTKSTMGAIPEVMLFEVKPAAAADTSNPLPVDLTRVVRLNEATATRTRNVTLEELVGMGGGLITLLNGVGYTVGVTETPRIGDTEVWNIINLTPDTHPIHLHQTMFQVLDRRPFDVRRYTNDYAALNLAPTAPRPDPTNYYTGVVLPPDANEMGWKDTVRANPGEVTRIIMKWETYDGDYVWHCHILEHEDHEMMRPLKVLPAAVV